MTHVLAIGTRKGLWIARSDDREVWTLDGPHLLMQEVASVAWDTRRSPARLLVGTMSWHYGPTLTWTDDLGATWHETGNAALAFPEDTGEALGRIWQLQPDTEARPDVAWAFVQPYIEWVLEQVHATHRRPRYVGRAASASTATGLMTNHLKQLKAFLDEALG